MWARLRLFNLEAISSWFGSTEYYWERLHIWKLWFWVQYRILCCCEALIICQLCLLQLFWTELLTAFFGNGNMYEEYMKSIQFTVLNERMKFSLFKRCFMKEKESACWHGYQNSLQENGAFQRDIKVVIEVSRNNKLRVGARQTGKFS